MCWLWLAWIKRHENRMDIQRRGKFECHHKGFMILPISYRPMYLEDSFPLSVRRRLSQIESQTFWAGWYSGLSWDSESRSSLTPDLVSMLILSWKNCHHVLIGWKYWEWKPKNIMKGWHTCSGVDQGIVGILNPGKVKRPGGKIFGCVTKQNPGLGLICMAFRLWMVLWWQACWSPNALAKGFPEPWRELTTQIWNCVERCHEG